METFLQLGVGAKVLAYGIVPLFMAWLGNRLAAEGISDLRRRTRYNVAFGVCVVLGIAGTWFVESQSERAHKEEREADARDSKKALQALMALISSRQRDSDSLIASLAAKLDPANLAKAFAAANSQGVKREVASQLAAVESVSALLTKTREFVAELRGFGGAYGRRIEAIGKSGWTADSTITTVDRGAFYLETGSRQMLTTEGGIPLVVEKQSTAQLQLAANERAEFNAKYLARAIALRDQLIKAGAPEQLKNFPPGRLIAFNGYLTAPASVMDAADYLEALANLLTPATPEHP